MWWRGSVARRSCSADDAARLAAEVRRGVRGGHSVADAVRQIVAAVRAGGDRALLEYEERFGGGGALRVGGEELAEALAALDPEVRAGLEVAIENVRAVAEAGLDAEAEVTLRQGHTVRLRERPAGRAAVYVPAGRNPYPSTVVMGAVTARAAGVDEVLVATGDHPVILAACALCEVDAVFRMGGAQAVAALAYGTETVAAADVIVGPGSLWVQEAKRQVSGDVGIDGFAGPSDLVVIATSGARGVVLDALAQAEHGAGSVVAVLSPDPALLDAVEVDPGEALLALIEAEPEEALAFAQTFAPEHLQLCGAEAEALAPRVRTAGCVFVGTAAGTAFGDYVAGSNHVLPTEGAARFASGLGVRHFVRTMAQVEIGPEAAARLAPAGVAIAEAEGFAAHAASMAARMDDRP
jgi:histidinol dehydrogenase